MLTAQTLARIHHPTALETVGNYDTRRGLLVPETPGRPKTTLTLIDKRRNPLNISGSSLSSVILDIQDDANDNYRKDEIEIVEEIKKSLEAKECKCPRILITDDDPFNHMALEGLFMMRNIVGIDRAYNG